MATQTIQFAFLTGQTVTVKLFADDGSDTVLATPTATEATNRTGIYTFTQTDRAAGNYLITVSATGINAEYSLPLTLDTATFWAIERSNTTHIRGTAQTARDIGASVLLSNGTGTGQVKLSSGYVSPNWGDVGNPTAAVGLTGTTISSSQVVASVSGAVGSVTGGVTVTTNNDKTGYSLSQSFPTNFASMLISAGGKVTVGTNDDKTGYSLSSAFPSAVEIADQVWDDTDVHNLAGSAGAKLIAIQSKTDNLPADPADASDIAASFTTVNTKLDAIDDFVDTEVAAIKVVTDRLSGMLVQDGLVYQFTTNALENGAGGGGGATYIVVHPGYASRPEKVAGTTIVLYHQEEGTVGPIRVQTRSNDTYTDVDLTAFSGLHVVIKDYEMTEIDDIATVTISGAEDSQFSFPISTTVTGTVTADTQEEWHYYSLRDTDGVVICTGRLRVREG